MLRSCLYLGTGLICLREVWQAHAVYVLFGLLQRLPRSPGPLLAATTAGTRGVDKSWNGRSGVSIQCHRCQCSTFTNRLFQGLVQPLRFLHLHAIESVETLSSEHLMEVVSALAC